MNTVSTPILTQALGLVMADTEGKRNYYNGGSCVQYIHHTDTSFDIAILLQDQRRVTYSFYYDEPNKDLHLKRKHYEVVTHD